MNDRSSIPDVDERIAGITGTSVASLAGSREHICPPVSEEQAYGEEQDEDSRQERQDGGNAGENASSRPQLDDREQPSRGEDDGSEQQGQPDARGGVGANDVLQERQRASSVTEVEGDACVVQGGEGTQSDAAASEGKGVEQTEGDEDKKREGEKEEERKGEEKKEEEKKEEEKKEEEKKEEERKEEEREEQRQQGGEGEDEDGSRDKGGEGDGDDEDDKDKREAREGVGREEKDEEEDEEEEGEEVSVLGLHSHWESTYEEELETFQEYGDVGEIW